MKRGSATRCGGAGNLSGQAGRDLSPKRRRIPGTYCTRNPAGPDPNSPPARPREGPPKRALMCVAAILVAITHYGPERGPPPLTPPALPWEDLRRKAGIRKAQYKAQQRNNTKQYKAMYTGYRSIHVPCFAVPKSTQLPASHAASPRAVGRPYWTVPPGSPTGPPRPASAEIRPPRMGAHLPHLPGSNSLGGAYPTGFCLPRRRV